MNSKRPNMPDSDVSARHLRNDVEIEKHEQPLDSLDDFQTSNKAGSHSTVEKLAASRSEFSPRPSAGPVSGAFGDGDPRPSGTGQHRCNSCGRFFDDEAELLEHETECRAAKQATHQGAAQLEHEDTEPHPANDRGR